MKVSAKLYILCKDKFEGFSETLHFVSGFWSLRLPESHTLFLYHLCIRTYVARSCLKPEPKDTWGLWWELQANWREMTVIFKTLTSKGRKKCNLRWNSLWSSWNMYLFLHWQRCELESASKVSHLRYWQSTGICFESFERFVCKSHKRSPEALACYNPFHGFCLRAPATFKKPISTDAYKMIDSMAWNSEFGHPHLFPTDRRMEPYFCLNKNTKNRKAAHYIRRAKKKPEIAEIQ